MDKLIDGVDDIYSSFASVFNISCRALTLGLCLWRLIPKHCISPMFIVFLFFRFLSHLLYSSCLSPSSILFRIYFFFRAHFANYLFCNNLNKRKGWKALSENGKIGMKMISEACNKVHIYRKSES